MKEMQLCPLLSIMYHMLVINCFQVFKVSNKIILHFETQYVSHWSTCLSLSKYAQRYADMRRDRILKHRLSVGYRAFINILLNVQIISRDKMKDIDYKIRAFTA